ncbi:MAG TPA: LLM class flavin-dependent oxidoreductase [Acidimicrobiales bacterium]|nr:LLM class flavin-dependent oxidoreductase [Acidimicrobiales bacterium]
MDHSLRIGLELPALPAGAGQREVAAWVALATAAERAGFGALWIGGTACDPCTLAGGLVPLTDTIVLGVVCELAGDRHPAVLARDLTGLDVVSGGRSALLLVGPTGEAGGGGALGEAASICRALFDGEAPHLAGRHYSVEGAVNRPGPTRPGGPILLGQPSTGEPVPFGQSGQSDPVPVDGWVVTSQPAAVDGPVLWRGAVPDADFASALLAAGISGVVARTTADGDLDALADILRGGWGG